MGRNCGHPECETIMARLDNAHQNFNVAGAQIVENVLEFRPGPNFANDLLRAVETMRDVEAAAREWADALAELRAMAMKAQAEMKARMGQVVPLFPGAAS